MKDEDLRGTKRSHIIEAAVYLFQEHGFHATSMDEISARANVSKRTLYKYFESKDVLFQSIVAELSALVSDTLTFTYDPARSIQEQLTELAWAEASLMRSPEFMAACRMLIAESFRSAEIAEGLRGKIDKTAGIVAFFKEAAASGALIMPDPEAAATEFVALMKARGFWPVIFGEEMLSEAAMSQIVENSVAMMMARYAKS